MSESRNHGNHQSRLTLNREYIVEGIKRDQSVKLRDASEKRGMVLLTSSTASAGHSARLRASVMASAPIRGAGNEARELGIDRGLL